MPALLKKIWAWWEPIARRIGDFQARVFLLFVYFVITVPFVLVARLSRGRFGAVPTATGGFWTERPPTEHTLETAGRQY